MIGPNGQWARSDHQIILYKAHHYNGSPFYCRCMSPLSNRNGARCKWDCCDWKYSDEAKAEKGVKRD